MDTDIHTGRRPHEGEGKNWGDVQLRDTKDGQQATRNEQRKLEQILHAALGRNSPCVHLGLAVLASRSVRQLIPAVSATQTVVLLLLQSKQTKHVQTHLTVKTSTSFHSISCFHFPCFPHLFSDSCSLPVPHPLPCNISHFWFHLRLWLHMNLGPKGLEILGTNEMLATVWFHPEFLSSENTGPDLEKPSKGRYQGFP